MIATNDLGLNFGSRKIFEDVNIKFVPGNCYGVIGANGAGKSTFLKVLSGELKSTKGNLSINPDLKLSILKQDHFEFNNETALDTVIMGNQKLIQIRREKDSLYAKEEMTEAEGIKVAELELEFSNENGWEAESEASTLLNDLGIPHLQCY